MQFWTLYLLLCLIVTLSVTLCDWRIYSLLSVCVLSPPVSHTCFLFLLHFMSYQHCVYHACVLHKILTWYLLFQVFLATVASDSVIMHPIAAVRFLTAAAIKIKLISNNSTNSKLEKIYVYTISQYKCKVSLL